MFWFFTEYITIIKILPLKHFLGTWSVGIQVYMHLSLTSIKKARLQLQ